MSPLTNEPSSGIVEILIAITTKKEMHVHLELIISLMITFSFSFFMKKSPEIDPNISDKEINSVKGNPINKNRATGRKWIREKINIIHTVIGIFIDFFPKNSESPTAHKSMSKIWNDDNSNTSITSTPRNYAI